MQNFMIALLICSVTMSALALFYMAVTPLLTKRYSVTSRYYTWIIIVIGLIIPFRPQWGNPIVKVEMPSNTVVPSIQIGKGIPVTVPFENALPSALPTISLWQFAAIVWGVGLIVFLVYHVLKHYHFLKMVGRWSKDITDEQSLTLIQDLKFQMGLNKNIGLQFCESIGSPMMIGFAHPRILLPKADFAKDELSFILKHELVHYQRKDLWYKCLVLIATAIHWFNPIVYLMAKEINIQCELSCDEKVVRDTNADTRLFYSETIIGVVRHHSKLKTALSTNFYGGKKGMKKRIFSIMDMSKKKVGVAILCATLLLTLGTGFAFATSAVASNNEEHSFTSNQANADLYSIYVPFDLTVNEQTGKLYYDGKLVRCFDDQIPTANFSSKGIGYYEKDGVIDIRTNRENTTGELLGLEKLSGSEFQKRVITDPTQPISQTGTDIFDEYKVFGLSYDKSQNALFYNGERVRLFTDIRNSNGKPIDSDEFLGSTTSNLDANGTIDVYTVRDRQTDENGDKKLTGLRIATQDEFDQATKSMGQTTRIVESAK